MTLGLDAFFARFGISKVVREGKPEFDFATNGKPNRYLNRQMKRLERLSKISPLRFWKLARHLIRTSKTLRIVAIRNVRPHWYKSVSEERVLDWMKELNNICGRPRATFEINRVAIPKPDGTQRYINDPGVPWRMYLWMWNFALHFYLKDRINASQHGHRPGRGSVTCWKEILDKVYKYKHVYEFDYKKFHDLIGRKYLLQALLNFKVPKAIAKELIHLSSPYVRGTDEEDPLRLEMIPGFDIFHYYRGVIQGSNIAAYLGLLVLEDLGVYNLEKGEYIGYADDGLLMSNDVGVVEEWKSKLGGLSGVEFKEEKSGWVKLDGIWLKDLKFVGLCLENSGEVLRGATRSGRIGQMIWRDKSTDEIWNFLSTFNGRLEGDRTSGISPRKESAWDKRGYADLGFLSAMVFSDNMFNNNPHKKSPIQAVKESVWNRVDLNPWVDNLETGSTLCFSRLRMLMSDPGLSEKSKLRQRGCKKAPEEFICDLGGWMKVRKERLDGIKHVGTAAESTKNVTGHTPSNPVGFDLMPSASTRPTPFVLELKTKVKPPRTEVIQKLAEFAERTKHQFTGGFLSSNPLPPGSGFRTIVVDLDKARAEVQNNPRPKPIVFKK